MSKPDLTSLYSTIDATWPPAAAIEAGPWLLREGRGGGKRVSAATAQGAWQGEDVDAAEKAMQVMGQPPLFMIRNAEDALDAHLAARGYALVDPVNLWLGRVADLTDTPLPRVTAFAIWEPLEIMKEIWSSGGIDAARLRVMDRAATKTGIFGRVEDRPAGAAFCALQGDCAMVHALEILERARGKGLGGWMMRAAAFWAQAHGASWISALCTQENEGANRLYASLGFEVVGQYHYRILPEEKGVQT